MALADRIGSIKLLAQPALALKPMIEEAIVPSKATRSTYSSYYLRKVTSYLASWTGCVSKKLLRGYRKKGDAEWQKFTTFACRTNAKQVHLHAGTKELVALCGD